MRAKTLQTKKYKIKKFDIIATPNKQVSCLQAKQRIEKFNVFTTN